MPNYSLDTTAIIALARNGNVGKRIGQTLDLANVPFKPIASIVTLAEARVLAATNLKDPATGEALQQRLPAVFSEIVLVSIEPGSIVDAYINIMSSLRRHPKGAQTNRGQNDVWIAATAVATQTILISADTDFLEYPQDIVSTISFDPKTGDELSRYGPLL